jgi:signal transduction histidine kinase
MSKTALSEFISIHRNEILRRCLNVLRDEYPRRTDNELMDTLPRFIDEISDSLRRDADAGHAGHTSSSGDTSAGPHGKARNAQGFELNRIVHDYGMVCDIVSDLAAKNGQTFNAREFQIFNRCIDDAIAEAISSFDESRSAEKKDTAEQLGFIAHEIRNAVGNALLGLELIRRGKAGMHGRTAESVQRALSRIADLVAVTLTEARLIGDLTQRERINLSEFLKRLASDTPRERGIEIHVHSPSALFLDIDERLMEAAITNLLQNAVKFTRDNCIVFVRASSSSPAVTIEVEDRCGGLPDRQSDDLFLPFRQATTDRRGQGLGLAIARRAVEAHGGSISTRSLPGIGCVFVISLPPTSSTSER